MLVLTTQSSLLQSVQCFIWLQPLPHWPTPRRSPTPAAEASFTGPENSTTLFRHAGD